MPPWPILAETAVAQQKSSNPRTSAWVRANAGSGKTHVLAQRVVRLLLDGADPSKILCLTYTKAAAANMSLRIFSILSKWTELDDESLRRKIGEMGVRDHANLDEARRLFARAVETPGGLKIQTIHAFCERILHLFPFEANVPASFEPVDAERQGQLMDEARLDVLQDIASQPDSALAQSLRIVAGLVSGVAFDGLLREALSKRVEIGNAGNLQAEGYARALRAHFGLAPDDSEAALSRDILDGGPGEERWSEIVEALGRSGANDKKKSELCRLSMIAPGVEARLEAFAGIFFTGKGDLRKPGKGGRLVNKEVADAINDDLLAERDRIVPLFERLKGARAISRSRALVHVADAILGAYKRLKQAQGMLDFEDLIERTANLFARSDAAWILYKLDAGIDHVLVDEAQDNSPQQWSILKALVSDFFAGESARPAARSVFAVGDQKQSIFSFQGAAPREFAENARYFAKLISNARMNFANEELKVSFRSSETILQCVDSVFAVPEHFAGLETSDNVGTAHQAWKSNLPGLVEIWEAVAPQATEEPEDWLMPLDVLPEHSPASILANRIADKIAALLDPASGEAVHDDDGKMRPVRPGDIMILVRRRNSFFDAVIKALKVAGVPVAGADRLKLMDHIAVMDLVAAGHVALLPQDDFTLACVLKSPLFDFDDDDLLRLAPTREGSLFAQLQMSVEARDRSAAALILAWGALARTVGPFRFYAHLLGAGRGRRAIRARLGVEAGDAIDEFLRLALEWERNETASLAAFLHRMQGTDIEVKRDMEAAGDAVRVMTVHAAKGLEAKIVFLPDTISGVTHVHDPKLVSLSDSEGAPVPVWRVGKTQDPEALRAKIERLRGEDSEEYRRLLYVAMTRAEERLYVSGYRTSKPLDEGCWYDMIYKTLQPNATSDIAPRDGEQIWRIGAPARLKASAGDLAKALAEPPPPAWLFGDAPHEASPQPPLRPSRGLDAADQIELVAAGDGKPARRLALLEGTLCHALLQYLPGLDRAEREAAAERFLLARGGVLAAQRRSELARQILAVMEAPALAPLFGGRARAEAAIAGRIVLASGREVEISGRIDRLAETDDSVLIADFKTGTVRAGVDIPRQYVTQMALYRAALAPLFPGKPVRAMIVWTGGPEATEIEPAALDAALADVTERPLRGPGGTTGANTSP